MKVWLLCFYYCQIIEKRHWIPLLHKLTGILNPTKMFCSELNTVIELHFISCISIFKYILGALVINTRLHASSYFLRTCVFEDDWIYAFSKAYPKKNLKAALSKLKRNENGLINHTFASSAISLWVVSNYDGLLDTILSQVICLTDEGYWNCSPYLNNEQLNGQIGQLKL